MKTLVDKRLEYVNKVRAINIAIDSSIQSYREQLELEVAAKLDARKAELTATKADEVDALNKKIAVLDEIIAEDEDVAQHAETTAVPAIEEQKVEISSAQLMSGMSAKTITDRPGMAHITIPQR